ncbi:NAD(P)/FAD-dependent oxidoreductase [Rummeliibacillus suwonensis]|uniref:NAD(P)/FAD-dependent oxidoreductase n=1 Tax=Rummeliibacillus suwonensis TaxID=1306154 RepID=UPI0011B5B954|nr:NAD(P)/FAD-dependent oxidoreductase [Rummeliibacillus suwonensis]
MQKIAIIGGGPAGLMAAIDGAKKGLHIDLYDQYNIGDHIRCAEGFFDTLNILGEPKYGVRFKVKEIELEIKKDYVFPCDEKTNIWMIDRREWQIGLAAEARDLGVHIYENSPVSKEKLKELSYDYDWVIDSSGVPSVTSKVYRFNQFYKETSGITVQYTLLGDFSDRYGSIKAALEEHYDGYYWIFPKSNNEANVGLIFFSENHLKPWEELERIIEKEGLSTYTKTRKFGGMCPVVRPEKLVYDNIILTGDAAGLVSALHGGGIDNACISGQLAIQCIAANNVEAYETEIDRVLGDKLKGERDLADLVYSMNLGVLDGIVKMVRHTNKSIGDFGFLNGHAGAFKKFAILKGLMPKVFQK